MLRKRRPGQGYVEFIIVLPLLLLLVAGVIAFGQAFYVKLATQAAAWSGARHAIATVNGQRGVWQGYTAPRYTLAGFGVNPDTAQVTVAADVWGRGTNVQVQVCYPVPAPPVPFGDRLIPTNICSKTLMPTYKWKAKW